jgi:hypothetical protein
LEYVIIFWGNSSESRKVFQLQKKIIRIMTESESITPCKPLFQTLEILILLSQYVLFLMTLLANNLERLTFNSSVHNISRKSRCWLHRPVANLILYQNHDCYAIIKIFNALPMSIAELVSNKKHYIIALKRFLIDKSLLFNCC